jgi:hypothetical protein
MFHTDIMLVTSNLQTAFHLQYGTMFMTHLCAKLHMCTWRINSSGMWHCATGPVVPDVNKDCSAITFRVKESSWISRPWRRKHYILKNVGNYTSDDTTWYPRRLKFATAPLREPQILQRLFVMTIELEAKENVQTAATLRYISIQLPCYTVCPYSCHVTLCVHTAATLHCVSIQLSCYTCTYTYIPWIHKCHEDSRLWNKS